MDLTGENVEKIFFECLYNEGENIDSAIKVESVKMKVCFHPDRLLSYRQEISQMLRCLPNTFHLDTGGGWTFLNMCQHIDGSIWTGLHQRVDQLLALGLASGFCTYTMPRDMWDCLPGSMPYITIDVLS